MSKSITTIIDDLQAENEHLNQFFKLFEKALKIEFGISSKEIRKAIVNNYHCRSEFEGTICDYFGLTTDEDKHEFIRVMCTDSSLRFFHSKR